MNSLSSVLWLVSRNVTTPLMLTALEQNAGMPGESVHQVHHRAGARGLRPLFEPRSVAVIGASESPGSVGRAIMENLGAFGGALFAVNPHRDRVLGRRSFSSIQSIPERVDLAVIATPAAAVPTVVRECAACGVGAAVIISAGFREVGPAGAALEKEALATAHEGNMRILGPNCLGLMIPRLRLNATFSDGMAAAGNVAFLSQSGALCTAVLDWSRDENVGFSGFVSCGSMADVDWGDLIYHFGDDPHTRSIVCYMESLGDARRFLSAAREVALSKPIVILKVGRSPEAARAAASHTGSLTGSDAVLDAAFRRVGVLRVATLGELFDMAEVLSKQPAPRGPRLAIVTNAGGPGVLATDALRESGAELATLSTETLKALDAALPPHWSHGNPVDVLGDADVDRVMNVTRLIKEAPEVDGICVIVTPQAMTAPTDLANRLASEKAMAGKPLLASWMGGPAMEDGRRALNAANIPTYDYPDTAARAFGLMWKYSDNLRALYETPALPKPGPDTQFRQQQVREILASVGRQGRLLLTEVEAKQVLSAYDIPIVETIGASTVDAAVLAAERLGYPVVVKLLSETITHKSRVRGVRLGLHSADEVRDAWASIEGAVAQFAGPGHFQGLAVQRMAPARGCEIILGSSMDSQFGPVLLFGAGGTHVEMIRDRSLGLPPLNATLARRMMEPTRVFEWLKGSEGNPRVNLDELDQLLVRFSQLVVEHPRIAEIDINPLQVSDEGMVALDARMVLHPDSITDGDLPKPAIRPYPTQYIRTLRLRNGKAVTIRPIRPEDEPAMVRFHRLLSEQSVRQRYFATIALEQRIAHERLSRICFIDYDRELALVAEWINPDDGQSEVVAVGRLSKLHEGNEGEFALLVQESWQQGGLGAALLEMLVQVARDEKLACLGAVILPTNVKMLSLARRIGFKVHADHEAGECRAVLML